MTRQNSHTFYCERISISQSIHVLIVKKTVKHQYEILKIYYLNQSF